MHVFGPKNNAFSCFGIKNCNIGTKLPLDFLSAWVFNYTYKRISELKLKEAESVSIQIRFSGLTRKARETDSKYFTNQLYLPIDEFMEIISKYPQEPNPADYL